MKWFWRETIRCLLRCHASDDCGGPLEDKVYLVVVVVAIPHGPGKTSGGYTGASGLVAEINADLLQAFVEAGEEDGFLVFAEAFEVAIGTLGEQKTTAGSYLEALVDKLVLVRVRKEAQVYFGAPDRFAVLLLIEFALGVKAPESF